MQLQTAGCLSAGAAAPWFTLEAGVVERAAVVVALQEARGRELEGVGGTAVQP